MELAWPPLDLLVAFAIAYGLCVLAVYVTKAFFGTASGTLGKLPVIGGWINSSLNSVEHKITHYLGTAAAALDARMGATWHAFAREIDKLGRELWSHASLIAAIVGDLNPAVELYNIGRRIVGLWGALHAIEERIAHGIDSILPRVQHVERGIGNDVLPGLRGIERELHRVETKTIPGLRAGERAIAGELSSLRTWVHRHTLAAGTIAFAGAVAIALDHMGLRWLRCNSLGKLGRRIGCGGFSLLDSLLEPAIDALVLADLCELVAQMSSVARAFEGPLIEIVSVADALVGCHGATVAGPLPLNTVPLAAPAAPLALV